MPWFSSYLFLKFATYSSHAISPYILNQNQEKVNRIAYETFSIFQKKNEKRKKAGAKRLAPAYVFDLRLFGTSIRR